MSQSTRWRHALIALLLAAPPVVAGSWLAWFQIMLDSRRPVPDSTSLARALEEDAIVRAFAHFRSGQDPNAPVPIRDRRLTGGGEMMATPLLIAVAYNRPDSVRMLMSSGTRLDAPGNRFSVCLARRMGHTDLAEMIVREGGVAETCPQEPHSPEAPLRAYVE